MEVKKANDGQASQSLSKGDGPDPWAWLCYLMAFSPAVGPVVGGNKEPLQLTENSPSGLLSSSFYRFKVIPIVVSISKDF